MTTKKAEPLGEAPASMNWYGVTKGGWNVQFTLRDTDEYVLLTRFDDFIKKLDESYVTPKDKQNGNGSQPSELPNENVSQATPELHFDAIELVGESKGEKEYWKIKGGKYTVHGVTIWPEVLDAAGIPSENLDIKKTYKLDGYTAYYELNENGNPRKVVNLAKP